MTALLSIEGLTLASGVGPIVSDVSFEVRPGEIVGIVGKSGSGKTMAVRSIIGLLPQAIRRTQGRIVFEGRDLAPLRPRELRPVRGRRIGMVFQEPMTSLNPALTIGRQLDEGLVYQTKLSPDERRERILSMLSRIGLSDGASRLGAYPHEFSGGMRQRIMIASAMLLRPALLIADEPTTALDAVIQREVAQLMVDLTREQGAAAIMISHDLAMVAEFAGRVVVMERGRIVETGRSDEILLHPAIPIRAVCSMRCRAARPHAPFLKRQHRSSRSATSSSIFRAAAAISARPPRSAPCRASRCASCPARPWRWSAPAVPVRRPSAVPSSAS